MKPTPRLPQGHAAAQSAQDKVGRFRDNGERRLAEVRADANIPPKSGTDPQPHTTKRLDHDPRSLIHRFVMKPKFAVAALGKLLRPLRIEVSAFLLYADRLTRSAEGFGLGGGCLAGRAGQGDQIVAVRPAPAARNGRRRLKNAVRSGTISDEPRPFSRLNIAESAPCRSLAPGSLRRRRCLLP